MGWVAWPTLRGVSASRPTSLARRGDEVLLVRTAANTWWLPGGGVEFGEFPEECLVREFGEETGLAVEVGEVRAVVSDVCVVHEESVRFRSVRLVYSVDVADQPLRPETDGSTGAPTWVPARDVPALPLPEWLLGWLPGELR